MSNVGKRMRLGRRSISAEIEVYVLFPVVGFTILVETRRSALRLCVGEKDKGNVLEGIAVD